MRSHPMLKIAYTMPRPAQDEARRIAMLLDSGWHTVHLRHPGMEEADIAAILRDIPREFTSRIVLHDHFSVASEFEVGALHLNSRHPEAPTGYCGATTASCHSIEEVLSSSAHRYVTLSPIFDSISKPGYKAAFSPDHLHALDKAPVKVIALGGIDSLNARQLSPYPFAGYAAMGALAWHDNINEFIKSYRCFNS